MATMPWASAGSGLHARAVPNEGDIPLRAGLRRWDLNRKNTLQGGNRLELRE